MTGRTALIAAVLALGAGLWLSGVVNSFARRRVLGIGPMERVWIAVLGGAAIIGVAMLFDIPLAPS